MDEDFQIAIKNWELHPEKTLHKMTLMDWFSRKSDPKNSILLMSLPQTAGFPAKMFPNCKQRAILGMVPMLLIIISTDAVAMRFHMVSPDERNASSRHLMLVL